ncbi:MAG: insulinase family protein [Clostridium sp.]|nr:insulinase family protein [Clostridium sp.]MCM1444344.1 insulinase family protein [Candidatus Amulumruptor caecigallinarius]
MKYKKIDLGSYNLHLINTDKFKTVTVRINFKRKVKKSDLTKSSLLSKVLLQSNKNYKSNRLLEIKTQDLYGLSVNTSTYISGNFSIFRISSTFLNDKYTEKDQVKKSLDFIFELLFEPDIENNKFCKEPFNLAFESLKQELESQKENPRFYSNLRADEETDKKASYSFNAIGYIEDLEHIDEKSLYDYYESMLKSDCVDIFVIGDINEDEIKQEFSKKFKIKTIKKPLGTHFLEHKTYRKRTKIVIEKMHFEQSNLIINFKLDKLNDFEKKYVMRVYEFLLGGGPNSKLFKEVREKNSLCYSINASYSPVNNIMKIRAGINKEAFKKCLNLIKKQVKKMEKGDFKEEDIEAAITTYISAYESITDSQNSIINSYESHEYLDFDLVEERIKNIKKVNKSMVVDIVKKIHIDTVYLLEGDTDE